MLKQIKRIIKALGYSLEGFKAAYKNEPAFRQEIYLGLVLVPVACFLPTGITNKLLLIGSFIIVLLAEVINSAIEAVVDYISEERHHLAKRAKDLGSSAVLLAFINLIVVWGSILYRCYL